MISVLLNDNKLTNKKYQREANTHLKIKKKIIKNSEIKGIKQQTHSSNKISKNGNIQHSYKIITLQL